VANTLCNIGWTIVGSLGTVLLTVVGQCIGAGEQEQARRYARKILVLGHILVFALFGTVFLLRHQLVRLFDFGPEALELAAYYTGAGALLTMCALYGSAFLPVAAFRSAGDVRYAVIMAVSTMFIFRVGLSYLLNSVTELGLMCVWLGMYADWLCRTVLNTLRFRSGKWLHKKLI
jgi:Na+-driven multidrug efflux pump